MFSVLDLWGGEGGLGVDGAFVGSGSGGEGAGDNLVGISQEIFANWVWKEKTYIIAKKLFVNNIDNCGDEGFDVLPSLL